MKPQLAVQTYTIREFTRTRLDLEESFAKIAMLGYPAVQLSAVGAMCGDTPKVSPELARKILDANGLQCIATHRSWESLAGSTSKEIDFHQALGCDFAAIGGLPGGYQSRGKAGFEDFLRDSAPVIAELKSAGIRFGYHNHAWEFERVGMAGTLFDTFIEDGSPDFLLELDLYWVSHAGVNPERVVERCAGRMPVIHVKDKEMLGSEPIMAPMGEGNLDWAHLLPACAAAGAQWLTVEQDECRRDPFDCLRSSLEFLRRAEQEFA